MSYSISAFYIKAWGQKWPSHSGTIFKTDILKDNTLDDIDEIAGNRYGAVPLEIDEKLDYTCYEDISAVGEALKVPTKVYDVLIPLSEFCLLRESMEHGVDMMNVEKVVVTGQPGIGKTTFLLYLLIHRLERKLPTAVQFNGGSIIIFNERGVHIHSTNDKIDREGIVCEMLKECWALVDSNVDVIQPFLLLQTHAKRLIQATSSSTHRWQNWLNQFGGAFIVSELPKVMEIAAIVKELGFEVSSTLPLVQKWGTSIRVVTRIIARPISEADWERAAVKAAQSMCDNPRSISELASDDPTISTICSTLLFVRPVRVFAADKTIADSSGVPFIPTRYLGEVFEDARIKLSNEKAFGIFCALSPHIL